MGTSSDGRNWAGTYTASMSAGVFDMKSAGVNCKGSYDPADFAKRLRMTFTCSDGRTGSADVVRDNDAKGGSGTVTFSDGISGTLSYGDPK